MRYTHSKHRPQNSPLLETKCVRLADFIRDNHGVIVKEWETFAATLTPAADAMTNAALRDHAVEILTAIVDDMNRPQGRVEQAEKSKGQSDVHRMEAVGRIHAGLRVEGGFKLDQLVAEYRALRASVLRLWGKAGGEPRAYDLEEVTRFNEAIDEALTEATNWYSATIEKTRDQFLAILGHDLRNPIAGILLSAAKLKKAAGLEDPQSKAALRIMNSAQRMERMVNDLLDLTRTRLGGGIPVALTALDLEPVLREVLGELEAAHPDWELRFQVTGDLRGDWDRDRVAQVISNIVGNAFQHGKDKAPIRVIAEGQENEVVIAVKNEGPPIPPAHLSTIFEAMVRHGGDDGSTSLGLGLYIAREIVNAHHGTISVTSTTEEGGTTFTVRLPRHGKPVEATHGEADRARGESRPGP